MGVNDALEQLESAKAECVRLEKENAELRAGLQLAGGTEPGELNSYAIDAGQWAARWNMRTPEMRQAWLDRMQDNMAIARTCIDQDHQARLAHLEQRAPRLTREQLARAYDPDAFDDTFKKSTRPVAQVQWAARRKLADDAALRVLNSLNTGIPL